MKLAARCANILRDSTEKYGFLQWQKTCMGRADVVDNFALVEAISTVLESRRMDVVVKGVRNEAGR